MKRRIAVLTLLVAAQALFASESPDMYRWMYRQAESFAEKASALETVASLDDSAMAPLLAEGLSDMVGLQVTLRTSEDRDRLAKLFRVLLARLGDWRHAESAADCWAVFQGSPDALARAEALIALGKMGAADYAGRIAQFLGDMNANQWDDKDAAEKVAFGCILSLERLGDIRGYVPVFFAATGWYSQRVRDQAARSLVTMTDDPTIPILEIIRNESANLKLVALNAEFASKAPRDSKIGVAVQALLRARELTPRDKTEATALAAVRILAIKGLIAYKATTDTAISALRDSLRLGDVDEKALTLSALGAMATDSAAAVLRDYLLELNDAQTRGVSDEIRDRLARAAISSAGASRNPLVRPALLAIQNVSTWSGAILRAAAEALKALP